MGCARDGGEVLVTGAGRRRRQRRRRAAVAARLPGRRLDRPARDCTIISSGLGAAELLDRAELAAQPGRPLDGERWAGAVDAVGGATLATILTQLKYGASVAACGLAGGSDLPTTVIPFLLRGVNLLGIDSVMCPHAGRVEAWRRLARDLPRDRLAQMTRSVPLAAVPELAPEILSGAVRGRVVVDLGA